VKDNYFIWITIGGSQMPLALAYQVSLAIGRVSLASAVISKSYCLRGVLLLLPDAICYATAMAAYFTTRSCRSATDTRSQLEDGTPTCTVGII